MELNIMPKINTVRKRWNQDFNPRSLVLKPGFLPSYSVYDGKEQQKTQEKQPKLSYHYLLSGKMKQTPNWFLSFCTCLLLPFVHHIAARKSF